jgi:hypothetical protein
VGLVIAVDLAAGCASPEPQTAQTRNDKVFTTGSRIPVRDGNTSAPVKSIDNREATQIINDHSQINIPPKNGPTN